MKKTKMQAQVLLTLIKPYRVLPNFKGLTYDEQTVSILFEIMQVPSFVKIIKENLKQI